MTESSYGGDMILNFSGPLHEEEPIHEYSSDAAVRNEGIARLMAEGLVVFDVDAPDVLTVDLDKGEREIPEKLLHSISGIKGDCIYTTSRGGKRHFWAKLADNTLAGMRSAMACALGGDPMREYLSLVRHYAKVSPAYAMFETPDEAAKVLKWAARVNATVRKLDKPPAAEEPLND